MLKIITLILVVFINKSFAVNLFYNETNFTSQINYFSPVGQSFLITSPNTLFFGFDYSDCNAFLGSATISFTLYDGAGIGGTVLLQNSFQASPAKHGMAYFDVSSINFIANNTYTVQIASTNSRGCMRENVQTVAIPAPGPNYPDGHELYQGVLDPDRDLKFHLLDDAVDLSVNATHITEILVNQSFNINVMLENLVGSTTTNADVMFDTDLNVISTTGCQEDPNGYPLCTINDISALQNSNITLLVDGQTAGSNFFNATFSNDTFELDLSNNSYTSNINILSESIFVNGFE